MKFGRVNDPAAVDYTLPPEPLANVRLLERHFDPDAPPTRFYVGATGWSMKQWVGTTYPKGARPVDFLKYYGEQFNTIELNSTHYRIPDAATVERWYETVPTDFRFCPKIPQSISHARGLGLQESPLELFVKNIVLLREKLGCCFMQLPPFFQPDRLPLLRRFLEQFPADIPLAVEVRHEDWFNDAVAFTAFTELLEEQHRPAVITDVPGRRDVAHMRLTTPVAMLRWNGNGLHETDYSRTDEWIGRLKIWAEQGLRECYIFTHEPDNVLAPEMAQYWVEQLRERIGVETRGPVFHRDEGAQMSLFG